MTQSTVKRNVREALREVKRFEWEGDYRPPARAAIRELLEELMQATVDEHLEAMAAAGLPDWRNGRYTPHYLTEVGDVVWAVSRTRSYSVGEVLGRYRRRAAAVKQTAVDCFVLGGSTRKVGQMLAPLAGERVSPQLVSTLARRLDAQVAAYQRRSSGISTESATRRTGGRRSRRWPASPRTGRTPTRPPSSACWSTVKNCWPSSQSRTVSADRTI